MKVKIERQGEELNANLVIVEIGDTKYRIEESNQGKLIINKTNFDNGQINIFPSYSNQIEIN